VASLICLFGIARYLSIEAFGQYSFIIAFVSAVMSISFFGTSRVLIRETSKDMERAAHFAGLGVAVRSALIVLSSAAVLILAISMGLHGIMLDAVMLAIAINAFQSYTQLMSSIFQAFEMMKYEPLVNFISSFLLISGIVAVILLDLGFIALFAVLAFVGLVSCGYAVFIVVKKFVIPRFDFNRSELKFFLKEAAVVGVGTFLYMNLFKTDVLLLKWLGAIEDIAYFQGAHNIVIQTSVFPTAIMAALTPAAAAVVIRAKVFADRATF